MHFALYKKKMELMYQKSKFKLHPNFSGVYFLDFIPLQAKRLKYEEVGKNKFLFHIVNKKICMN